MLKKLTINAILVVETEIYIFFSYGITAVKSIYANIQLQKNKILPS